MMRSVIPLAVVATMMAAPALAQQSPAYQSGQGGSLSQSDLAPVSDVVTAVEQRLDLLGYNTRVDGEFDADLRNSVMLFQSDSGLRPTGNIDLSTIAALGIDVDPSGRASTAMTDRSSMPQSQAQTAIVPADEGQVAGIVDDNSTDYPLLRDEKMSAPMTSLDEGDRFENFLGTPQPEAVTRQGDIPGIEPGFFEENLR